MIKKVQAELVPLTRELAKKFDEMQALAGERTKEEKHLKFFDTQLRDGNFQSPTWAIAIWNGVQYRADGQHSSHLLATCEDKWFPQDQSVTINTYTIDSTRDATNLFEIFDNPISVRSNKDKMGVYLVEYPDLAAVERSLLGKVARGIDYLIRDSNKDKPAQQQLLTFAARDHGLYFRDDNCRRFALWLHPSRVTKHAWMFSKPGIVAEMFSDWLTHADLASAFWAEVLTESNPDPSDETRELSTQLKDWSRKQPRVRQDKFRMRAKRTWDRYRRLASAQKAGAKADAGNEPVGHVPEVPMMPPPIPETPIQPSL